MRAAIAALLLSYCGTIHAQDQLPRKTDLDREPVPITLGSPKYPENAKKDGKEGIVYVSAFVNAEGKVTEAKIEKSSAPVFNEAALEAVQASTFTPARKEGKPIGVWITIPYKFALSDGPKKK